MLSRNLVDIQSPAVYDNICDRIWTLTSTIGGVNNQRALLGGHPFPPFFVCFSSPISDPDWFSFSSSCFSFTGSCCRRPTRESVLGQAGLVRFRFVLWNLIRFLFQFIFRRPRGLAANPQAGNHLYLLEDDDDAQSVVSIVAAFDGSRQLFWSMPREWIAPGSFFISKTLLWHWIYSPIALNTVKQKMYLFATDRLTRTSHRLLILSISFGKVNTSFSIVKLILANWECYPQQCHRPFELRYQFWEFVDFHHLPNTADIPRYCLCNNGTYGGFFAVLNTFTGTFSSIFTFPGGLQVSNRLGQAAAFGGFLSRFFRSHELIRWHLFCHSDRSFNTIAWSVSRHISRGEYVCFCSSSDCKRLCITFTSSPYLCCMKWTFEWCSPNEVAEQISSIVGEIPSNCHAIMSWEKQKTQKSHGWQLHTILGSAILIASAIGITWDIKFVPRPARVREDALTDRRYLVNE